MSRTEIERITGYHVRPVLPQDAHRKVGYAAFDENEKLVAEAGDYEPRKALNELLFAIYKIH